jgi:anti-sigma factor RsiW
MICGLTNKISLLIDDELSRAEAREADHHLMECLECQRARADFLSLRSQIAGYNLLLNSAAGPRALAQVVSREERSN